MNPQKIIENPGFSWGNPGESPGNPGNSRKNLERNGKYREIPENPETNYTPFQLHPIEGPLRKRGPGSWTQGVGQPPKGQITLGV